MKILITADCYEPVVNGLVTSTVILRKNLMALGHDVKVLTLSQTNRTEYKTTIYYNKSKDISFLYPNLRLSLHIDPKIYKEILEWKPDVIHSQNEVFTLNMAKHLAKKLSIPIVHTYHTLYEDYTHYFIPNKKMGKKIVASLTRNILRKTQAVIAPSVKTEKILLKYKVKTPIYVVPTGIELDIFSQPLSIEKRKEILKKYNIPSDKKILLILGRIAKEKNIDELFYNLAKLPFKDFVCLVVGDGPHKEELIKLSNELEISDKIIFTGMVSHDEVPNFYKISDLFISASNSETQGLTYFEAMASGLPVVCRQDVCLTYIVINDWNGYQYNTFDSFSEKLHQMLSDDEVRLKMSKNAIKTAEKYSSEEFAKKALFVYTVAIEQHHKMMLAHEEKKRWTTKKT